MESSVISLATMAMQSMDLNSSSLKYVQHLLKRLGVFYMAMVIILGFIGNSMSCYVFVRSKLR